MSKQNNKKVGQIGEKLATQHLKQKGCQILEKNWGSKWGEIDLIAQDKDTFVFVEVKTKIGLDFGSPEEMINPRKLRQIQRLASIYQPAQNAPLRLDVIAIVLDKHHQLQSLNHYQNVS